MMRKTGFNIILLLGVLLVIGVSCNNPTPFGGPVYDKAGNLKIDSVKIADFLQIAEYDSLYRIHDPSGVVIIVQEEGIGSRPQNNDVVYGNYVGKLLDGTVFDTNIKAVAIENDVYNEARNYNIFQFMVNSTTAIEGFTIGFKRIRSGSKAVLIIPSPYAYRNQEDKEGVIPPNSVLIFEIDFLGLD